MLALWTHPAARSVESNVTASTSVTGSTSEATVVQDDCMPLTSNPLENWAITDDILRAEIFFEPKIALPSHW